MALHSGRSVVTMTFPELRAALGLPEDVMVVTVTADFIRENVSLVLQGDRFPAIAVGLQDPVPVALGDIIEKKGGA